MPELSTLDHFTHQELLAKLHQEFERLNHQHLGGAIARPEIVISQRKSYGGYYLPKLHRIVMSWQAYQEHGWDEAVNTFRHEVAHAVHPNHSQAFWELASQLGCTQRYASKPLKPRMTPKYVYECPNCSRRLLRHRLLKKASCGVCDKKYNPRYALQLIGDLDKTLKAHL